MAFETTRQEILKQAIELKKLYDTTRIQKYKDEELRLRRIAAELSSVSLSGAVTQITAGSNVTISPTGGTGNVTINAVGDMTKAVYDSDNDGTVDAAETTQIIVRNSTGSTLTKGQVVYLSGATGNRPNAVLSQANTEATSSKTIGIVVANIANNSDGYVAVSGTLHDLDTSAFTAGDAVWLSATTAGAYTSTIPAEPNHTVFIGYVARSHPTQGRLVILIQNGYELNELHGVLISAEANNDLLVYESSSTLWKNKSISTIFGGTPLVSVPTLAQVTTAGNTTTNAITVGGLNLGTNVGVTSSSAFGLNYIEFNALTATQGIAALFKPATGSTGYAYDFEFRKDTTTFAGLLIIGGNASAGAGTANKNIIAVSNEGSRSDWLAFRVAASNSSWSSATDLLSLTHTQNVLIGTTTDAGYKLDVAGTLRNTTSSYFATTSGSVGIGTTSPSEKLDVQGPIRLSSAINQSLNGFSRIYTSYSLAKGETYIEPEGSTTPTRFFPNGGVVIGTTTQQPPANGLLVTGNIGVGTVAPTYKIDVRGTTLAASTISAQGAFNIFRVAAPTGTLTLTPSTGGSVDVGQHYYFVSFTTALGETNVALTTAITIVSGSQTVTITGIPVSTDPRVTGRKIYRTRAGQTSDRGMVIATIADNITTSYVDTAADSTFPNLGDWGAYRDNTTSSQITIDGTKAMALGTGVTSIGIGAGASITTAGLTTLVGTNAGNAITYGFQNTLVGTSAGRFVTTGSGNTVLGGYSLMWVTTGSDNIAIGRNASFYNVTGSYNIAIGSGVLSGQSGVSHNSNIGIGSNALASLGAADNNIAIGYFAGRYISSGSINTLSSNSIFIGYDARPNADSETNQVVIGNNGRGLGSNTTILGNSSTTFTSIPAGNMTIGGTTNAGYKLDVNGTLRATNQTYFGDDKTFTSSQYYYLINASSDGLVVFNNTTTSVNHATGYLTGELYLDGSSPFNNHRNINTMVNCRNTSTSNIVRAFYASGRTDNTGAANTVAGFLGGVLIGGSGNVTNAIGLEIEILSQTNNKTITNLYGVKVQPLTNSVGTITNTYGVYIDSLTAGTQTNAAYGIYQAGSDRNYFNGSVGIGTSSPTYKLDVNGTARIQSSLTVASLATDGPVKSLSGMLVSVAGYTGLFTVPTNPPGMQTLDIQDGIIVNIL